VESSNAKEEKKEAVDEFLLSWFPMAQVVGDGRWQEKAVLLGPGKRFFGARRFH
jgi:hypothetical protein